MDEATELVGDCSIVTRSPLMDEQPFQGPYQIPPEASYTVYTPMHVTFLFRVNFLLIAKITINVVSCNQLQ